MLSASLVTFSMIAALSIVAHLFRRSPRSMSAHQAREANAFVVVHFIALTVGFVLVMNPNGPTSLLAVCATLPMMLKIKGARPNVGVLIGASITTLLAVAIGALPESSSVLRWPLAGGFTLTIVSALWFTVGRSRRADMATRMALITLAGAAGFAIILSPSATLIATLCLIPAWGLVAQLLISKRRPRVHVVIAAGFVAIIASAATVAAGMDSLPVALKIAGLSSGTYLSIHIMVELLVGPTRIFGPERAQTVRATTPDWPLDQMIARRSSPRRIRAARGTASATSLLKDAAGAAIGEMLIRIEDRSSLHEPTEVHGDLPSIVRALESILSEMALLQDEAPLTILVRSGRRKVVYEFDRGLSHSALQRAQGVLASQGGEVFASGTGTSIILPTSEASSEALEVLQ